MPPIHRVQVFVPTHQITCSLSVPTFYGAWGPDTGGRGLYSLHVVVTLRSRGTVHGSRVGKVKGGHVAAGKTTPDMSILDTLERRLLQYWLSSPALSGQ